ncbi:MAG: hypothetical protein Q9218_000623 [Villophora microphyllina]
MTDATRHGNALPSLSYIDLDKIKKENSFYNTRIPSTTTANMPAPPLVSPSSMCFGPPPPYSYPSSTTSSVVNGYTNGYISPPSEPRRPVDIEKDQQQVGRQSLPSIHEALGRGQPQPLSITSLLTDTSVPPPPQSHPAQHSSNHSPISPVYRSHIEFLSSRPPVTPSHTQLSSNQPEATSRQNHSPRIAFDPNSSRGPSSATRENQYPPMLPPRTVPSPAALSRPPMPSAALRHSSPAYECISRPAPIGNQPHSYGSHSVPYCYPPTMPTISSSFQPPSPSNPPTWRYNERGQDRPEEDYGRNGVVKEQALKPTYGEAIKRHLDNFDLETSLNEIAEGSGRALDFSRHYGSRAHQTQRSGPIPGSIPTLAECDEMLNYQKRVLDSMQRIKEIILAQQQALAEQRNYESHYKPSSEADEDGTSFNDKLEGSGGFAGADAKKRRGVRYQLILHSQGSN